ncbi:hypothetical protein Theba_0848 [Mesotoga prima MesG1.Ag.4.2]|uniref:Uncharacterized protein n=1 Tax=Mesotoga prima MesG1.Ag.4.2 TaxID=660470 RepID=I2F3Q8_9BACT|nr:hypothetical protein Theba_0848 [Mesotoga prima MesG1.Ag.4.2]
MRKVIDPASVERAVRKFKEKLARESFPHYP